MKELQNKICQIVGVQKNSEYMTNSSSNSSLDVYENPLIHEEDIEEFYEAFSNFRIEGESDVIDFYSFPHFLRTIGQCPTEAEILQMLRDINALDANILTFNQVLEMMMKHFKSPHTEEELTKAFNVFDRTGDGILGTKEILFVVNNLGENYTEDDIREMFLEIDKDRDGRIKVDDFIALMGAPEVKSRKSTRNSYKMK